VNKFAYIVYFPHHSQLGKYIGFSILSRRIKNVDFAYVMDHINSRLDSWKTKLLIICVDFSIVWIK